MEVKEIGVGARMGMRGLKYRGIIEIAEDPKGGDFILVIGNGLREKWYRKWLKVNLPKGMWQVTCKKEEVPEALNKFLAENILGQG
jgi:hypothetical protein